MKGLITRVLVLCGLAALLGAATKVPPRQPAQMERRGSAKADAARLKSTVVVATLDTPLVSGKNVLWCGTFQLAWNEACALVGHDLRLEPSHPMADALNRKSFTKQDLDEASYVALAGLVKDNIFDHISRALRDKFGGLAQPELASPRPEPYRPEDLVAYSYLLKNLQFRVPFGTLESAFRFGKTKVMGFGMHRNLVAGPGGTPTNLAQMAAQILVRDYRGSNDFLIELKTKSADDHLLLARIKPAATLAETIAEVHGRAANRNPAAVTTKDIFVAPKLNFDLTQDYTELLGRRLVHANPRLANDLVLVSAVQRTRFQLDEKGAVLHSESQIHGGCSSPARPRYLLIFDQPFLILLEREGARTPYFALWVDNAELLVRR